MQLKISLKWTLFIVGIAGIIFSSIVIFLAIFDLQGQEPHIKTNSLPNSQTPQNLIASTSAGSILGTASDELPDLGLLIRLKIPKINVDAAVESVGLTPNGDMDAPKGPANVGWYNLGPLPGEKGSAVIDGHSGWGDDIPAVFDNLHKLHEGDKLYIEDEKGTVITFVVREIRTFDPIADATVVFGSSDGKAHLNLITCAGVWDETQESYSDRLVVFTDKEIE